MVSGKQERAAEKERLALGGFLVIQSIAAVYFVGDSLSDILSGTRYSIFEIIVALALFMGMLFGVIALSKAMAKMKAQEQALAAASGALAEVISVQFGKWGLTPAEKDVGILALKGFDVAEIAELRNAAAGTVRAQLARIYAKAKVSGRAQFAAFFVEDLLGHALVPLAA